MPTRPRPVRAALVLAAIGCAPAETHPDPPEAGVRTETSPPELPVAVSNNAVVSVPTPHGTVVFSFLGIDSTKRWDGLTRDAFRWDEGSPAWRRLDPVPGAARLAATAQTTGGLVYLFGGYTVAEDGSERSTPDVVVYDPALDEWSAAAPIPIPVDDAVSGVWRDSLIYLVSGWHDSDNEAAVQVYDPAADTWRQATPIPGPPVFGHTGGISGNSIVYLDGARLDRDPRRFTLEPSSWHGEIDPADPTQIDWTRLPDHPGPALYRGAAVGTADRVIFVGGGDNTYNYDGNGYDGRPSEPVGSAFAWVPSAREWVELTAPATPTMDHRGLIRVGGTFYTVGGMVSAQRVTPRVIPLP